MSATDRLDWITPGAPCIVYEDSWNGTPRAARHHVVKAGKRDVLLDSGQTFRRTYTSGQTLRQARPGGMTAPDAVLAPADDPTALAVERRAMLASAELDVARAMKALRESRYLDDSHARDAVRVLLAALDGPAA